MAERFLKIEVIKEMISEIYVVFDDEKPEFVDLKKPESVDLKEKIKIRLPKLNEEIVKNAMEETLEDYDWEDCGLSSYYTIAEVPKEEALEFTAYDATNKKVYEQT
jgi:hypothetical protein